VIPTRYFLGRPDVGEEMHISIEKGKTLIIRLMAVGPVIEGRAQRDVWFEVNGEVSRKLENDYWTRLKRCGTEGACRVCRGQEFRGRNGLTRKSDKRSGFCWRTDVWRRGGGPRERGSGNQEG
jgi:hypothetical protein